MRQESNLCPALTVEKQACLPFSPANWHLNGTESWKESELGTGDAGGVLSVFSEECILEEQMGL